MPSKEATPLARGYVAKSEMEGQKRKGGDGSMWVARGGTWVRCAAASSKKTDAILKRIDTLQAELRGQMDELRIAVEEAKGERTRLAFPEPSSPALSVSSSSSSSSSSSDDSSGSDEEESEAWRDYLLDPLNYTEQDKQRAQLEVMLAQDESMLESQPDVYRFKAGFM